MSALPHPSVQSVADFRWAQRARLLLGGGALLLIAVNVALSELSTPRWVTVTALATALLFIAGLIGAWRARRFESVLNHPIAFLWDTSIVTTAVVLTGGPTSPFLSLYLPLIMIVSIRCRQGIALSIAIATATLYAFTATALVKGVIPNPLGVGPLPTPTGGIALQVIGLLSAMILISVAVHFLLRRLHASQADAAATRQTLTEIREKQKQLVDSLPEGVILVDERRIITRLNRAAAEMLHTDEESNLGTLVDDLFAERADRGTIEIPSQAGSGKCTITSPDGASLQINVAVRPLDAELHGTPGFLFALSNVTELRTIEEQLAVQERLARLLAEERAQPNVDLPSSFQSFVGESPIMQKVLQLIQRVAASEATALVHGESGTGKELVARALHSGGKRARGPFIPVNCGAIPENLLESELFGHMRGAFTGAENDHPGLFRQASGGTIFLDEIGELPLSMQAKLLRVLQERSVHPVGSTRDIPIDVRIVAATNRNLKREVEGGRFREDLYYRLNVITISLPPLRERREDLPRLIQATLHRLAGTGTRPVVSPQATQLLLNYRYPGNVRELENILERAYVLGGQVILPEHLPDHMRAEQRSEETSVGEKPETQIIIDESIQLPADLDQILASIERRYLETALMRSQGAKKRAAELLGINFRSFRYRLQKFGLSEEKET